VRRGKADQAIVRSWNNNRAAGIAAETYGAKPRGHADAGARAGAATELFGIVRTEHLTLEGTRTASSDAVPVGLVCLGENDCAGLPKPIDHEGVTVGLRSGHGFEPTAGRHIFRVVDVFCEDNDTVQGAAWPLGFALGVEGARFVKGVRIERDDGVEGRAFLIVGLDPREVELNEFLGRE